MEVPERFSGLTLEQSAELHRRHSGQVVGVKDEAQVGEDCVGCREPT